MSHKYLMINVDELWLKGKNRSLYFKAIRDHLKKVIQLCHASGFTLTFDRQRYILFIEKGIPQSTIEAILKIPGLHSVSPALCVPQDPKAIFPAIKEELSKNKDQRVSFKVVAKRVDKRFPIRSMDINREMGGLILKDFPHMKVDVHRPDIFIHIKILDEAIYITTEKLLGVGGLPCGMSGHLITMLSGGLDSPVASYLMSKRGCRQTFIFFYAYPFVGDEVKEKILELLKILGQYQKNCFLYVVPFGDLQKKISNLCRVEYRTLLFRYAMIKCAEICGNLCGAEGILIGDSLAQVSSQTIGNMALLDSASELLLLRPLIGYNKSEIVENARKIETFNISIRPYDDACSMFAPKHPIIRPDKNYWQKFIENLELSADLHLCLGKAECFSIGPRGDLKAVDNDLTNTCKK